MLSFEAQERGHQKIGAPRILLMEKWYRRITVCAAPSPGTHFPDRLSLSHKGPELECKTGKYQINLPAEMGECLVGIGHFVRILAFFDRIAFVLGGGH